MLIGDIFKIVLIHLREFFIEYWQTTEWLFFLHSLMPFIFHHTFSLVCLCSLLHRRVLKCSMSVSVRVRTTECSMLHAAACCVASVHQLLQFRSSLSFRSIRTIVSTFFLPFRSGCIFLSVILTPSFACRVLASSWFLPHLYRIDVTHLLCHTTLACVVNFVLVSRSEFALKFFLWFFSSQLPNDTACMVQDFHPLPVAHMFPLRAMLSECVRILCRPSAMRLPFSHRRVHLGALTPVVCCTMPHLLRGSVHHPSAASSVHSVCHNLLGDVSYRYLCVGACNFVTFVHLLNVIYISFHRYIHVNHHFLHRSCVTGIVYVRCKSIADQV